MGLAAVAAWQAVSASWAPDPERALEDAFRGTVYVAAAASFLVLARAVGARAVVVGVVFGGAATLATAWSACPQRRGRPVSGPAAV